MITNIEDVSVGNHVISIDKSDSTNIEILIITKLGDNNSFTARGLNTTRTLVYTDLFEHEHVTDYVFESYEDIIKHFPEHLI